MIRRLMAMVGPIAVARASSLALGAVQLPVLTRQLPASDYALIAAAIAAATYVSLVVGDPTTLGFQRFPGSNKDRRNYNFSSARLVVSLVAVLLAGPFVAIIFRRVDLVVAVAGWAFGLAGMRFTSTAWLMWQQPWRYTLNLVISSAVRTIVLLVAIQVGVAPLISLGLAGFASFSVAVILGPRPRWVLNILSGPPPWPRGAGVALALGSFGTTALLTVDKLLVPLFTDGMSAGTYAAMSQMISVTLAAFIAVVSTAMAPKALALWNSGRINAALELNRRIIYMSILVGSIAALVIMVSGDKLIKILLGPEYSQPQLAVGMAVMATLYAIGQQASWSQRYQLRFGHVKNASLAGAIVAVLAIPYATATWSSVGAMAAMTLGTLIYTLLMLRRAMMGPAVAAAAMTVGSANLFALLNLSSSIAGLPLAAGAVLSGAYFIRYLKGRKPPKKGTTPRKVEVVFVYQSYAVYREPLFRLLEKEQDLSITYLIGDVRQDKTLPLADQKRLSNAHGLRNVWFGRKLPNGPFLWQRGVLARILRAEADVFLFSGDWHHLSTWLAAAIIRLKRGAVVFHTMGWRGDVGNAERFAKRAFYALADSLFLYGERAHAFALKEGFHPERLEIVYNSLATLPKAMDGREEEQTPCSDSRDRRGLIQDAPTAICVSRLEPKRRADLLIRAAGCLANAGKPLNVILVGEFSEGYGAELRGLADKENVNLIMQGAVFDPERLACLYALSDVAVIPGAAGLAVIQALSHGKPVVTNDNWEIQGPEVEAVVPGKTGIFYTYDDVISLSRSIREGLALASLRGTSERCIEQVRSRYTPEAQAAAFTRGFKTVARRKR